MIRLRDGSAIAPLITVAALVSAGLIATAAPASAEPTLGTSFNPGLGAISAIAYDDATGNVFIYNSDDTVIYEYTPAGTQVDTIPIGPACNLIISNVDFDFAPEPVNMAGTVAPANSLLVVNGDNCGRTFRAKDKNTGADVAGPVALALSGGQPKGGSWSAARNTLFTANWDTDTIREYDVSTSPATLLNSFPVAPTGSPQFDINEGDIEVSLVTGNLYVVGQTQDVIRELTPTGTFVRDIDLAFLGLPFGLAGIALNDLTGAAWVSTTGFEVYRVDGVLPPAPAISIANRFVPEGDAGSLLAPFTVTLSRPSANPVTVNFNTGRGTATPGSDYAARAGTLTIPAGRTSGTIQIRIFGDIALEPSETFGVFLSIPSGATIADNVGIGGIINDD